MITSLKLFSWKINKSKIYAFLQKSMLTKTVVQFRSPVPFWMLLRKMYFYLTIRVLLLTKLNIAIKSACKAEAKKHSPAKSSPSKLRTTFYFHCVQASSAKGTYRVAYTSWWAMWAFLSSLTLYTENLISLASLQFLIYAFVHFCMPDF